MSIRNISVLVFLSVAGFLGGCRGDSTLVVLGTTTKGEIGAGSIFTYTNKRADFSGKVTTVVVHDTLLDVSARLGKSKVMKFGSSTQLPFNSYRFISTTVGQFAGSESSAIGFVTAPMLAIEANGEVSYAGNTRVTRTKDKSGNVLSEDSVIAWYTLPTSSFFDSHDYFVTTIDSATCFDTLMAVGDTIITIGTEPLPAKHIVDRIASRTQFGAITAGSIDIYYSSKLQVPLAVIVRRQVFLDPIISSVLTEYLLK